MRRAHAILLLVVALALGGCGYHPLYGTSADGSGVTATLASVSIPEATDRVGQIIRNDLISTMRSGTGEDRYALLIKPMVRTSSVIDQLQPAVTRQSLTLSASFDLVDKVSGVTLHSGKTFSQASFDVIRQPFADMQAQTNATERAAHEVSADIRTRIAAYFSAHPPKT